MPRTPAPHDLEILEKLEANPDSTQADLAAELGVAVGTVNFALRRLINKGYIHAQQMQRRRLKYILTPAGLALRAKLAMDSLNYGMRLYRETRTQAQALILQTRQQGYTRIRIKGEGDLAEIVRLTCLELGMAEDTSDAQLPVLRVDVIPMRLEQPDPT